MPVPVNDTQVLKNPSKYDKDFLAHINNIKGYRERHGGSLPIGWNMDYPLPQNPSSDERARHSYTRLLMNIRKVKKCATWHANMLPEVGFTRGADGQWERDPSTYY